MNTILETVPTLRGNEEFYAVLERHVKAKAAYDAMPEAQVGTWEDTIREAAFSSSQDALIAFLDAHV